MTSLDKVKHKEMISTYFAADIVKLQTGEYPDMKSLLFLIQTGDVAPGISLTNQFLIDQVVQSLNCEVNKKRLSIEAWFDGVELESNSSQRKELEQWISYFLSTKNHCLTDEFNKLFKMKIKQSEKDKMTYAFFNLNLIRDNEVPILNQPFEDLLKAINEDDMKTIGDLQEKTLELLNS